MCQFQIKYMVVIPVLFGSGFIFENALIRIRSEYQYGTPKKYKFLKHIHFFGNLKYQEQKSAFY